MKNNQLSTFFFVALMMLIFSRAFTGIFPLIIIFFIARSIIGSHERRGPRSPRDGRDYDRRDRRRESEYERRQRKQEEMDRELERRRREKEARRNQTRPKSSPRPKPRPKNNPYKQSGVKKFKDYDYDGAIEDFVKALEIDSTDVAVHFNIACCYSLNEQKDKAFYHLSKAVALGFKDFEKIQSHDALAYLRIQDEFDDFKKNGYRIVSAGNIPTEKTTNETGGLLEQLNKLQELRERGVLTEEEFVIQKEKLLK